MRPWLVVQIVVQLYEIEQRVKRLERCDCKLSCRWKPPPPPPPPPTSASRLQQTAAAPAPANETAGQVQLKQDGQVWESNCDVCSCHVSTIMIIHREVPSRSVARDDAGGDINGEIYLSHRKRPRESTLNPFPSILVCCQPTKQASKPRNDNDHDGLV